MDSKKLSIRSAHGCESKELVRRLSEAMDSLCKTLPLFNRADDPELYELIYHAGMTIRTALNKADPQENETNDNPSRIEN